MQADFLIEKASGAGALTGTRLKTFSCFSFWIKDNVFLYIMYLTGSFLFLTNFFFCPQVQNLGESLTLIELYTKAVHANENGRKDKKRRVVIPKLRKQTLSNFFKKIDEYSSRDIHGLKKKTYEMTSQFFCSRVITSVLFSLFVEH